MNNEINRTEELTSILRDKYHMQIRESGGEIFCFGGKLMNYPVQAFILPQFGIARFAVRMNFETDSYLVSGDIHYFNTAPMELVLNYIIEKFIKIIKVKQMEFYNMPHFRHTQGQIYKYKDVVHEEQANI